MKKITSILLIITILLPFLSVNTYSEDNEWYFIVTAYYSPLPGQDTYLTWDYNSEKKLNWEWINWASGNPVFSWMLAAPKNYNFWTKIYLEWLWVWEVSDRWGAIVNAWKRWYEHDRIDVWVWSGDEWLKRALYWWKRTVKWYVTDDNSNITLDYNKISSPSWATNWLKKISNVFEIWLWKWSDFWMVKKLQKLLNEVWLYNGEVDGIYNNKVVDIVYNFQTDNDIIKNPTDYWAWYWGKNTRDLFLKEYLNWDVNNKPIVKEQKPLTWIITPSQEQVATKVVETKKVEEVKQTPIVQIVVNKNIEILDRAIWWKDDVIKLQNILKEIWLYNWELTWDYKNITDTIYNYQLSKWLVTWIASVWAGNYGPKTRENLKLSYNDYLTKKESNRLEQVRLADEAKKAESRKKELEEKYKQLDELSMKKAQEKLANIWMPKFGEVSSWVRSLQLTLKGLGYFDYKDTAIYGDKTKECILAYQISKKLVSKKDDLGAWMIWPRTLETIKNDLKQQFLKELSKNEGINTQEIAAIVWNKI